MEEKELREEYEELKKTLFDIFAKYEEMIFEVDKTLIQSNKLDLINLQNIFESFFSILSNLNFICINRSTLSGILTEIEKNQVIQKEIKNIKTLLKKISENNLSFQTQQFKTITWALNAFSNHLMYLQQYDKSNIIAFERFFESDKTILEQIARKAHIIFNEIKLGIQLQEEIQKAQSLNTFYEDFKKRNIEKEQDIDRLTTKAIKQGLAQRYTQEKKNNNNAKIFWTIAIALGLLFLAFFTNLPSVVFFSTTKPVFEQIRESESFSKALLHIISTLPAYLALIWFILFASRRRNEANRLASDYAHKEVFASSYEAYLKEIQKLKELGIISKEKEKETEELATKLLDSMISVLSDNPAKSLDTKKTTDELPAKEIINLASEIIKFKGKNT